MENFDPESATDRFGHDPALEQDGADAEDLRGDIFFGPNDDFSAADPAGGDWLVDPAADATDGTFVDPPAGYEPVDTIFGNPTDDMSYWLFQGYGTGTCGPTSVAMIVADMLGMPLGTNDEVVQHALQLGLISYDPANPAWAAWGGWSGMSAEQVETLLESYSIGAETYSGVGVDTLAQYLDAGHSVVLFLDSDELLYGDDDLTDGGATPNHFVHMTGIDFVNGVVYMNDPARPEGAGVAVAMDVFLDSWGDAGNTIVMSDVALETPYLGGGVGEGVVGDALFDDDDDVPAADPAASATLLLPFTLVGERGVWIAPENRR